MFFSDPRTCAGCEGLVRSKDCEAPHEFLVLRRPGAPSIYQCLVCHSNLAIDQHAGGGSRWIAFLDPHGHSPSRVTPDARMQTGR